LARREESSDDERDEGPDVHIDLCSVRKVTG